MRIKACRLTRSLPGWGDGALAIVDQFVRSQERDQPIRLSTKLFQGLGIIPVSLKELAFNTFLLLYYNQVLGLSASYASLALLIALIVDALSDPIVGSFSDNFRHRLGRRHSLMYAASVPFAVCIYLLFSPPSAVADYLPVWLLMFALGTRLSFTFFAVPWNAMFAELSDDYKERSELISYRFAVGWIVGIVFVFSIYSFIFVASETYPQGQLNPAHYQTFALVLSLTVFAGAFLTTHLTRDQIPYLRQPPASLRRFSLPVLWEELGLAVKNRNFRVLIFAVLASAVVSGTNQALQIYMNTYFWDFSGEQLRWTAVAVLGGLLAFFTVLPLQNLLDKKYLLVTCAISIMVVTMVPVTLRLLELAPANGTPGLVVMIVTAATISAYFATIALIMFTSMVADTLDVQEYETGLRQEGLFNSVMTFASKATTGAGILIAGLIIDHVIGLPQGAARAQITPEMILRVGIVDAYVVPLFNVVWLSLVLQYSITRDEHTQIQKVLSRRRMPDSLNS